MLISVSKPVRRPAHGYLPSRKTMPRGWYSFPDLLKKGGAVVINQLQVI